MNPPYMPVADNPLAVWAANFTAVLTADPTAFGETSGVALTCTNAYNDYQAALDLVNDPATKTSVTVAAKNYQKSLMKAAIQPVAVRISGNPSVDPAQKVTIGVTVRIPTRTRASVADMPMTLTIEGVTPQNVTLRNQNPDTPNSTARPQGARLVEVSFRIRNADDTADEFTGTVSATRRFNTITTEPAWHGRLAIYKARWVGAALNGGAPNLGAWSDEVSLILP